MSRKSKGINAERDIIHMFWKTGRWAAFRIAGSGAIRYPVPDVFASNGERHLAIECKATKSDSQYLSFEEVEDIKKFSSITGAEPWFAIRFDRKGLFFVSPEDLRKTESLYVIELGTAQYKGVSFDELAAPKAL